MMKLHSASLTDVGMVRDVNEDAVLAQVLYLLNRPVLGLFAVCDGMGGHLGGEFASYWAIEAIKSEFANLFDSRDPRATVLLHAEDAAAVTPPPPDPLLDASQPVDLEQRLRSAIHKANQVVFDYALNKPDKARNSGTTLSMAVVLGDQLIVANLGDSRTYLLRDHSLRQMTRDHSLVAYLVAAGEISPADIYTHPQRNFIFRYLGQRDLAEPDIFFETLQPGDCLLLCSDGLWEMLPDTQIIIDLLEASPDPDQVCQSLIQTANQAGGEDNISVVLVLVS